MKNGPLFYLGLLSAVGISWGGVVLGSHYQLSSLPPYYDDVQSQTFPAKMNGIAARGQYVYADLGCAACHTQQVRRPGFGSDQERGWGERQSVARDYLYQPLPQLGSSRVGPDLATFGARMEKTPDAADRIYDLLYNGSATHPSYKFIFERTEITGQPSAKALKLSGAAAPEAGYQVVPSERAQSLVTYLLTLSHSFQFPEAKPFTPAGQKAAPAPGPAPEKIQVTPIPAAAPDEKKQKK
jgi:cytochrome c oxidase cbb3-type subunit 2